jgi:hypothetical protein
VTSRLRTDDNHHSFSNHHHHQRSFSNPVSSRDPAAMRVVSRDVIERLSHIRVISSELAKPARVTATPAVHDGALTPAVAEPFSSL